MRNKLIIILFCGLIPAFSFSQNNRELAKAKVREAISLMDNGSFKESIDLLDEAAKLDPKSLDPPYETAYAYYLQKEYDKASGILEKLISRKDVNDRVFQLLGNAYDLNGDREKAIETYKKGLKKFPNSGKLYLEMGGMNMVQEQYNEALSYYEKGIEVEPDFSSNYYWATKLFLLRSDDKAWGMMYGEIFMNLEPQSNRSAEISKLLFDTYKEHIVFKDTSIAIDFTKSMVISADQLLKKGVFVLPFQTAAYEMNMSVAVILSAREITIESLDGIRHRFIDAFYSGKSVKDYDNVLFQYEKEIIDAGHMTAYNYFLLREGDFDAFEAWAAANENAFENFVGWYSSHRINITPKNEFTRKKMEK